MRRAKGLYLHLPSHLTHFMKAMGDTEPEIAPPASLARRIGLTDVQPPTPTAFSTVTKIEVTDCPNSGIAGHQLVDVYRGRESRTYLVMDCEPTHRARVAHFVAQCRLRGIEVIGVVRS